MREAYLYKVVWNTGRYILENFFLGKERKVLERREERKETRLRRFLLIRGRRRGDVARAKSSFVKRRINRALFFFSRSHGTLFKNVNA